MDVPAPGIQFTMSVALLSRDDYVPDIDLIAQVMLPNGAVVKETGKAVSWK